MTVMYLPSTLDFLIDDILLQLIGNLPLGDLLAVRQVSSSHSLFFDGGRLTAIFLRHANDFLI